MCVGRSVFFLRDWWGRERERTHTQTRALRPTSLWAFKKKKVVRYSRTLISYLNFETVNFFSTVNLLPKLPKSPTNDALSINFWPSSDAEIFVGKHRLGMRTGAKRAKTCVQRVRIPTELPFCIPPLVVGNECTSWGWTASAQWASTATDRAVANIEVWLYSLCMFLSPSPVVVRKSLPREREREKGKEKKKKI